MLTIICLLSGLSAFAQGTMATQVVKENLFIPWEIIYGPDARIWMTQKNGYICRLDPTNGLLDTVYHETATVIRGEGGMTGMALHPNFPTVPYVYVVHNYLNGAAYRIRVMRYTYNGSSALGSPLVLLDGISGSQNHNGSRLLIVDSQLYITTGDAEDLSTPQNSASINGKILRINLDGTLPADNPQAGNPVWSKGHRNPQGMVSANGFIYSSEHGPNNDDELNIIRKGRNYGWPTVAGYCNTAAEQTFCTDSNVAVPLIAWTPTLAVAGIDYYNQAMFPALQGKLIMATLKDQHLYSLALNGAGDSVRSATVIAAVAAGRLRDICISPAGRIYISTSNSNAAGSGAFTDKIIELYDPAAVGIGTIAAPGPAEPYPNPVSKELVVTVEEKSAYWVVDLSGRQVLAGSLLAGKNVLGTERLIPGIYLLKLRAGDGKIRVRRFRKAE